MFIVFYRDDNGNETSRGFEDCTEIYFDRNYEMHSRDGDGKDVSVHVGDIIRITDAETEEFRKRNGL